MAQGSTSIHFGGALGVMGLAATLMGCTYLAANGPGAQAQAWWPMPTRHMEVEPLVEAEPDAEPGTVVLADMEVPTTPTVKPVDPPRPEPIAEPAALAKEPPTIVPAQAETLRPVQATFIVKFNPDPAIDDVIAGWRSDRDGAIARFEAWAEDDPVFGNMTLEGCSYSGELLLSRKVEATVSGTRSAVSTLTNDIRGHSAVAYADPDFTAHPGGFAEE